MIAQPEADHAHASGACALPLQGMPRSGLYHLAAFVLPTTTTRLIECCNCHACSCLGRFLLHRGGGHHDSTSGWLFFITRVGLLFCFGAAFARRGRRGDRLSDEDPLVHEAAGSVEPWLGNPFFNRLRLLSPLPVSLGGRNHPGRACELG